MVNEDSEEKIQDVEKSKNLINDEDDENDDDKQAIQMGWSVQPLAGEAEQPERDPPPASRRRTFSSTAVAVGSVKSLKSSKPSNTAAQMIRYLGETQKEAALQAVDEGQEVRAAVHRMSTPWPQALARGKIL